MASAKGSLSFLRGFVGIEGGKGEVQETGLLQLENSRNFFGQCQDFGNASVGKTIYSQLGMASYGRIISAMELI